MLNAMQVHLAAPYPDLGALHYFQALSRTGRAIRVQDESEIARFVLPGELLLARARVLCDGELCEWD